MIRLSSGLVGRVSASCPTGRPISFFSLGPNPSNLVLPPPGKKPTMERRMSSSHSSRSPRNGSSNKSSPRPAAGPAPVSANVCRAREKAQAVAAAADADLFSHLPRVAATPHLDLNGVALSSFYSLHRPLHVNATFGNSDPDTAVDEFFKNGRLQGPSQSTDQVMDTLENIIKALSGTTSPGSGRTSSSGVHSPHPTGTEKTIKRLVDNHVASQSPFRAPQAPQPVNLDRSKTFHDLQALSRQQDVEAGIGSTGSSSPSLTATILFSKGDQSDQGLEYEMSIPVDLNERLDPAELENGAVDSSLHAEQPFMRRLLVRALRAASDSVGPAVGNGVLQASFDAVLSPGAPGQIGGSAFRNSLWRNRIRSRHLRRIQMRLMSVKRRRKLKIKKHKYKKLRQRTRTLRRKLDQL